jgi:hypothetical protein
MDVKLKPYWRRDSTQELNSYIRQTICKLDRASGLLLDDHRTFSHPAAGDHITDPQGDQVTAAQLAVDGQVEQGQVA